MFEHSCILCIKKWTGLISDSISYFMDRKISEEFES